MSRYRKDKGLIAVAIVATTAVFLLTVGCKKNAELSDPPTPVIHVPTLSGELAPMPSGDVTVFVFVRDDCPISNRYTPELMRLRELFLGRIHWWLIYPDPNTTAAEIQTHRSEYELTMPAYHDADQKLVLQTGAKITPEAAVYDSNKRLVYCGRIDDRFVEFGKARPAATKHDLQAAITAALSGEVVSPKRQPAIGCYIEDLIH